MVNILYVLLVSMVPIIELRGAIPIGVGLGLSVWESTAIAFIGNLIPIPFLIIFGEKVLKYFAKFEKFGKPFRKIIEIGEKKASKIKGVLFWGLLAFVAIPLPGTGAWTGALIAITLQLKLKDALPAIVCGVFLAGIIVSLLTVFLPALI
ncbi:MAG: hypothetical protein A2Y17_02015 [Clostridiales bacterium GWF2_38_85]|nr:MAG: hypothetical protein A2Y17_02015 [Clostridiales bacterium GWF2_38_85]HBL85144.1 small multidrug export protein [Clostridiales bacterium]